MHAMHATHHAKHWSAAMQHQSQAPVSVMLYRLLVVAVLQHYITADSNILLDAHQAAMVIVFVQSICDASV